MPEAPVDVDALLVCRGFGHIDNGVSRFAGVLCEGLRRHGVRTRVLTDRPIASEHGWRVRPLELRGLRNLNWLAFSRAAGRSLAERAPTGPVVFCDAKDALLASGGGFEKILVQHDHLAADACWRVKHYRVVYPFDWPIRIAYYQLNRVLERRALRAADRVVAVTHDLRARLIASYGLDADRCSVIYTGLEDPATIPARPPTAPGEPARLLFVGTNFQGKGLHRLLRDLAQCRSPWQLRVVGQDSKRGRFVALGRELGIEERIAFLGFCSGEEVADQYAWADAFLFASLTDSFGLTILEAVSRGVPVVARDRPGVREIREHLPNAPLTVYRDAVELERAVQSLPDTARTPQRLAGTPFAAEAMVECYRRLITGAIE